jgi:hypothetical protein
MRLIRILTAVSFLSTGLLVATAPAIYPQPAVAPKAWQLDFDHDAPKRIVVEVPGGTAPKAYWYLTYAITNHTGAEQVYLPHFELLTKEGNVLRSDTELSDSVFRAIARSERRKPLEPALKLAGPILQGEDQARFGVAIWEEPSIEMGSFSIFAHNLSGESAPLTDAAGNPVADAQGNPIVLRKTLQLDYTVAGDNLYAGDPIKQVGKTWVMR